MQTTIKTGKVSVCSPDKSFFVSDGSVYASLAALAHGLRQMHPDTYMSHMNEQKNDFHIWINDVFGDQKLARDVLGARNQHHMARLIEARLKTLK